jgi:hypothetical protein
MAVANTLAYYNQQLLTYSFIVQAPAPNIIKLFCRNLQQNGRNLRNNIRTLNRICGQKVCKLQLAMLLQYLHY